MLLPVSFVAIRKTDDYTHAFECNVDYYRLQLSMTSLPNSIALDINLVLIFYHSSSRSTRSRMKRATTKRKTPNEIVGLTYVKGGRERDKDPKDVSLFLLLHFSTHRCHFIGQPCQTERERAKCENQVDSLLGLPLLLK